MIGILVYKVYEQIQGPDVDELESLVISSIDLSLETMKEAGAEWLVEAFDYIQNRPSIVVNGFLESGITDAAGKL